MGWGNRPNFKSKGTRIPGLLVDDCDRHLIENRAWRVNWVGYVGCTFRENEKVVYKQLARIIMDAPADMTVDHINGNKLDNRRSNMRLLSLAENCQNTAHRRPRGRSGVKNVMWQGASGKWVVRVGRFRKLYHGGTFDTIEEAAAVAPGFIAELDARLARERKEPGREIAFG